MNKKDYWINKVGILMKSPYKLLFILGILVFLIFLDVQSKVWIIKQPTPITWGILDFRVTSNYGFLFGYFQELSLRLKEVLFVTLGVFVFCYYLVFLFFFPIYSNLTSFGATFFIAGILSNLYDRLTHQAVLDFATVNLIKHFPYFNFADVLQWIGIVLLISGIVKNYSLYWPRIELRKKFLINYKFQIKIALFTCAPLFLSNMLILFFSTSFFRENENEIAVKYYIFFGSFISFSMMMMTFLITLFLSNRISGPIQAVRRHIHEMTNGRFLELKFRENDEFKELEEDFNLLIKKNNSEKPPL